MGLITQALSSLSVTANRKAGPANVSGDVSATAVGIRARRVAKSNVELYRRWADHGEFVRTAIDVRKGQIERSDWDIVQFDRDGPKPDQGLMRQMVEQLTQPNPGADSLGSLLSAYTEDILVLDAGSIEKERKLKGEILYLWPTDGGRIKVDKFWDGDPRSARYYWVKSSTEDTSLFNTDLIYTMIHHRSHHPMGLSYMEILKAAIDAELSGSVFNARAVTQSAPDGVMDLGENARPDQVEAFKAYFSSEMTGAMGGLISFWGGTKGAKFIPFRPSNHDMQYMDWLRYNATKVAAVFQISVQDLQLMHDINRSQGEVQVAQTEDRGYKVLKKKVEDAFTAEYCWDPGFGGRKNNIAFRIRSVGDRASQSLANVHKVTLAGMPSMTINEARMDMGLPPIGDPRDQNNPFNKLMANTPVGLVLLDAIPTADDYLEARKAAGPPPGGEGGPDEPTPSQKLKQLEADLDKLQTADLRRASERSIAAEAMERVTLALADGQRGQLDTILKMAETMASRPVEVHLTNAQSEG